MKQRSLFENDETPEESPDSFRDWKESDSLHLAQIVFPTGLDGAFDYRIAPEFEETLRPGMRVMVPLGKANRQTLGYCIGVDVKTLSRKETQRLKTVTGLVDSERLLSDKMLHLARWIAEYYLCSLGTVLEAMLPAGVRTHAASRLTTVHYLPDDVDEKIKRIQEISAQNARKKKTEAPPQPENHEKPTLSLIEEAKNALPPALPPRPVSSLRSSGKRTSGETPESNKKSEILTKKQLYVLDVLRKSPEPLSGVELAKAAKCSQAPIQALKRLGLLRSKTIRRETAPKSVTETAVSPKDRERHELNPEQRRVYERIVAGLRGMKHETFLLRGVTGSGKTEVYIQAIEEVVRYGKQAIVLVPEISLTPQTVGRFKGRFEHIAVLHSHLSDVERSRQWNRIVRGEVQVVVGARSAIFAPVPNLGLIIIDEEHESSFKQDIAPRYHARDVAKKRAEMENVPLLLGSATPSLESWAQAQRGEYRLLTISNRVLGFSLPRVHIVDLRDAVRSQTTRGAIHRQLHAAIHETLEKKEQVILLLNRRGFSTQIQCPACGMVMKCPDCDVSLTHHRTEEIALCHYCDYQVPAPAKCPECGFFGIRYSGFGTQKLEQEITSRFPGASVLRMDTDTMQGHGSHERALAKFRCGEVQILLGTQMIAKGLDFPNVTLVGVINADTALHLPDFRASERTFLLITQVAGRTGRSEKGGRVIVQSFNPDHPAIISAAHHDYLGFVGNELPLRELLAYPPYTKMARFVIRGPEEVRTFEFAKHFGQRLRESLKEHEENQNVGGFKPRLLGPAPAPFSKLRGNFRFHIHVHAASAEVLRAVYREATEKLKTPQDVQWIVDIDPMDML